MASSFEIGQQSDFDPAPVIKLNEQHHTAEWIENCRIPAGQGLGDRVQVTGDDGGVVCARNANGPEDALFGNDGHDPHALVVRSQNRRPELVRSRRSPVQRAIASTVDPLRRAADEALMPSLRIRATASTARCREARSLELSANHDSRRSAVPCPRVERTVAPV